nr:MAG TPA: hypothetical protein [Caudoviricetes sp.]
MTYHTSINWAKLNQSGTNRTQQKPFSPLVEIGLEH